MIKYIVMGMGSLFFFICTKMLIGAVREENLVQGFVRTIDADSNGIISQKQLKDYAPCTEFDNKGIMRAYKDAGGRRVHVSDLSQELNEAQILKSIKVCKGNFAELTDIQHIKTIKAVTLSNEMFNTFDLSGNMEITWSEYHIINYANKNINENVRNIFKFLDKNRDWKITKKEADKVKPKKITEFMQKKRTTVKRR